MACPWRGRVDGVRGLLVGVRLWAARVRACLVLLRCYALGQSLRASRCLRRLPLAVIGCDTPCFAKRAQALGLRPRSAAVGLRRDLDLSMPLIDVCGAMDARRLDPWAFDFRCGYLESQSWREATRGAPNTASPVWQVASTGLRPSQLNSAQRVTAARAPAASLAFA